MPAAGAPALLAGSCWPRRAVPGSRDSRGELPAGAGGSGSGEARWGRGGDSLGSQQGAHGFRDCGSRGSCGCAGQGRGGRRRCPLLGEDPACMKGDP